MSQKGTLVTLDAETHNLRERPPSNSRYVRAARMQLLSQLDLATLSEDLARVSKLVQIARHAASAAGYEDLCKTIASISAKIVHLFDTTGVAISKFRVAAEAVLRELSLNHDMLSNCMLDQTVLHMQANDLLARELADASSALSHMLGEAADDAARAFSDAHLRHAQCMRDRDDLQDRIAHLRIRKAKAWETHSANLASLSDVGTQYAAAEQRVRRAERRATMFGMLNFLCTADVYLSSYLGVGVLTPVRTWLETVALEVDKASADRQLLLEAKVRQRSANRDALDDIQECSKRIREVKSEADAVMAAIESLHTVSQELKRLSVVVMSMSSFWKQVEAHMGHMSAAKLVMLLKETDDGMNTRCDMSGEEIDLTGGLTEWKPCTTVVRVLIEYYARWVALSDVCRDCLSEIATARCDAVREAGSESEMSPANAREEVRRMAVELQKEMEEINVDLEAFRERIGKEKLVAGD